MLSDTVDRPARWLAALILGAGFAATPVRAQTLLEWPDTAVNLAHYTTVDECLALAERTRGRWETDSLPDAWTDSVPLARRRMAPAPGIVTTTARRCAERFQVATTDLGDYDIFLKLLLLAGRDSDAAALVERRLTAATTAGAREAAIDTAVDAYLDYARPVRLAAAAALLRARARRLTDPKDRMYAYARLELYQMGLGDTVGARESAQSLLGIYGALTPEEQKDVRARWPGFDYAAFHLTIGYIGNRSFLDSLRKSTAAYVGLIRSVWHQTTGERPGALNVPVGDRAPRIAADFWFPAESGDAARPAPGRVTLIEFLGSSMAFRWAVDPQYNPYGVAWLERLVYLRRLAVRFPSLQIILVAQTRGSFVYDTTPSPADEAEWIRRAVEASQAPPGALLAVTSTPFWRLPAPDLRRVDRMVVNDTSYAFGGDPTGEAGPGTEEFLVDQDGLVVTAQSPTQQGFGNLPLDVMIETLLSRQRDAGASASSAGVGRGR